MKILLDHCLNWRLKRSFPLHDVLSAGEMGWERLTNGNLLATAAHEGFEILLTVDRNMVHQQNPRHLPISVMLIVVVSNEIHNVLPLVPRIEREIARMMPRTVIEIHADATDE